jgi:hypothetical protein
VVAKVRAHDDVGGSGEIQVPAARQEVADLAGHAERGHVVLGIEPRAADIDRHQHARAKRLRHVDRQVVHDQAVDELPSLPVDRGEDERDRHAGAHRPREVAIREDDRLAGREVPGDRPDPDGKAVEVARNRDSPPGTASSISG